jgi:hypothetical protein
MQKFFLGLTEIPHREVFGSVSWEMMASFVIRTKSDSANEVTLCFATFIVRNEKVLFTLSSHFGNIPSRIKKNIPESIFVLITLNIVQNCMTVPTEPIIS